MPNFSGAGPVACSANSLGAAALGERLRFSRSVMFESEAPINPSEFKFLLGMSWREQQSPRV